MQDGFLPEDEKLDAMLAESIHQTRRLAVPMSPDCCSPKSPNTALAEANSHIASSSIREGSISSVVVLQNLPQPRAAVLEPCESILSTDKEAAKALSVPQQSIRKTVASTTVTATNLMPETARLTELMKLVRQTKNESSIVIKAKPKKRQIATERGSKYRGVSKNGKKWQVSTIVAEKNISHSN